MAEQGVLSSLKEKYLTFVENLREKGVPAPHLVVPLFVLLVMLGAAFIAFPDLATEKRDVSLLVKDNLARPLSGATVEIISNGQVVSTKTTDASGAVSLQGVSLNAQIRVSAEGFQQKTRAISEVVQTGSVSLQSSAPPSRDVNVKVLDSTGQPVEGAFLQLAFASGDFAPQVISDASGSAVITILESQLGQGSLSINAPGFESTQQAVSQQQLESGVVLVSIQRGVAGPLTGDFVVSVASGANPVRGARVSLINIATNAEERSEFTYEDGRVRFEDIAFGTAFTVRATHSQFASFEREFTPTAGNNELSFSLVPRSSPLGEVRITVLTQELLPLRADVRVFDADSNTLLESGETNANGEFSFTLTQGINAYATAYTPNYLPGFVSDIRSGAVKTINLVEALPGNSVPVSITVTQDGFPASNSEVSLYRSGGFFLGVPPLTAGAQGIANATIPLSLEGSYRVSAKASKGAYFGQSDLVDVAPSPISLSVDLLALPTNVTVKLLDLSTNSPIASGTVEAIIEGLPVSTCEISSGQCVLIASPDKQFSVRATAPGFLSYTSALVSYSPAEQAELELKLLPLSLAQGASITFLGLFDSSGAKVREVVNAETYKAKFAVSMPQNVESAGFYLQTGEGQTVQEDVVSISSFNSNGAPFVQSASALATGENCYAGENNPNVDNKWVFYSFPRGFVGTKEFTADLKISRDASPGEEVLLKYKAFGFKDNLPLLAPSDAELLEALRSKIDAGQQLAQQDTCAMKTFSQTIPVSQQVLKCQDNDICWRATLSDQTNRGTPSTYSPEIAKQFTIALEVLAPFSIDSLAISTDHFSVSDQRQTLAGKASKRISFAREYNVPFTSLPNRKASLTASLTPLRVSQHAPLSFILRSGDQVFEIALPLSISGTDVFTVTAAPQRVPAVIGGKVTVVARNRAGEPVTDAAVTLFECVGSPFSGNEPGQVIGDDSIDNGQNGRYSVPVTPTGIGEIGVRVEKEGFRVFESCLVSVEPRDFLSVEPNVLEFTGSSLGGQSQQVTITNSLSEIVRISSSVNCGGDAVPVRIFPTTSVIEPLSDSVMTIKLLENVSANTQCIATFTASVGTFKTTEELSLSVNVNCDGCQLSVANAVSTPLPSSITLFTTPPFFQDAATIPLRLQGEPTCRIEGFRITHGGLYQSGPVYPSGVLAGIQQPAIWWCAACGPADKDGRSECTGCQQLQQSSYQCGACQPRPITAPTSSSLPIHGSASCLQCFNSYSAYQSRAFMSPLAYQGYGLPFNPAYNQQIAGQRFGFDQSVGAPFREDFGYGGDYYGQRFGAYPVLPGSPYNQRFSGYNYGNGYSRDALRDAVRVEECTASGITVAADYSFLGQAYPGSGNLRVTLPDGSQKTIRVNVFSGAGFGTGGYPFGAPSWPAACGVSSLSEEVRVGPDYKFSSNTSITLTCPTVFDQHRIEKIETTSGQTVGGACDTALANNVLSVNCDFSRSEDAKKALNNDKALFIKAVLLSSQNPSAKVDVSIKAVFEPPTVAIQGGQQQGPIIPPINGSVVVKVFRASDTSFSSSLCGTTVETGAPLKIKYSFSPGDDASARKVVVKKLDASWTEDKSFTGIASSGVLDYTVTKTSTTNQQHSFEAFTTYAGKPESAPCSLTVSDQTPLLRGITPVYSFNKNEPLNSFTSLFPLGPLWMTSALGVDAAALAKRTSGDVQAKIEYQCADGSHVVTQTQTLKPPNYVASNAHRVERSTNSLDFTKCQPTVDSISNYRVKVTLQQGTNVLETKYWGAGDHAVEQSAATTFAITNYPEAPRDLPPVITDSTLDACGRMNSPVVSAINIFRGSPSAGLSSLAPLKSSETLSLGDELFALMCTKNNHQNKKFELLLEYTKVTGEKATEKIGDCTISATAKNGFNCGRAFRTDAFLSQSEMTRLRLNPVQPVSFKASIAGVGERFFCKYWPGQDGSCEKVEFKVSSTNIFAYAKNRHCILLYPPNPNILLCDLAQGEGVELATGMFLEATDVSDEVELQGYYAPDKSEELDCDAGAGGDNMEFSLGDANKWKSCFDEGPLLGEETSFIAIQFKKVLDSEVPIGESNASATKRARIVVVAQFGSLDSWLGNGYNYSFNVHDKSGRLLRRVGYILPVKTMTDLGFTYTNDGHQGAYVFGDSDVAKINSGEVGIIRYRGKVQGKHFFEVRRRDKPVIQDCKIDYVPGVVAALGGVAGAALCLVPGVNVAMCPLVSGIIGAAGAGASSTIAWIPFDEFLLPVEVGDTEQCRSLASTPDVMVHVIGEVPDPKGSSLPAVCAVVTTDKMKDLVDDWDDKLEALSTGACTR